MRKNLRWFLVLCALAGSSAALFSTAACEKGLDANHKHGWSEWTVETPATCEEPGLETRFCTNPKCGYQDFREIPATGHNWGEEFSTATCTEDGVMRRTCLNGCGKTQDGEFVAAHHTWDEGKVIKEATCQSEGITRYTCTVCKETENFVVQDGPHTFELVERVEPKCVEEGYILRKCSVCGEENKVMLPATGHHWHEIGVNTEPTCTESGKRNRVCVDCETAELDEIPALGHAYVETVVSRPTFEEEGEIVNFCSRCHSEGEHKSIAKLVEGTPIDFEFRVLRNNGIGFADSSIVINIYDGTELVATATDAQINAGVFKTKLNPQKGKTYRFEVTNLPQGYSAQPVEVSPLDPFGEIYLTPKLIASGERTAKSYRTGSVMEDFTYNTINGEKVVLSELLEKYDAVLLNFFYVHCTWCDFEFPGLIEAYNEYKGNIAVIGIAPAVVTANSSITVVRNYVNEMNIPFYVVYDTTPVDKKDSGDAMYLHDLFGVTGYPYSAMIDKEGVVTETHRGAVQENLDPETCAPLFKKMFATYTAEDYWKEGSFRTDPLQTAVVRGQYIASQNFLLRKKFS